MGTGSRTVRCPWCGRGGFTLTRAGAFRQHGRYTASFSGGMPERCEGSGKTPKSFHATTKEK